MEYESGCIILWWMLDSGFQANSEFEDLQVTLKAWWDVSSLRKAWAGPQSA